MMQWWADFLERAEREGAGGDRQAGKSLAEAGR
jgi:hypothetical protein